MVSTSVSREVARSRCPPGTAIAAADAVVRGDDHPGVAVEEVEPVVVAGQQQRPPGVPLLAPAAPDRQPGVLGEPALDEPVPVADAPRAVAVGAEQAVPVEDRDRARARPRTPRPRAAAGRAAPAGRGAPARTSGSDASSSSTCSPPAARSVERARRRRRRARPRRARRSPGRTGGTSSARRRPGGSRRVSPPTRSASTAPASTEASWSGSPTSTSRQSARTASTRRAIIVSDTIEVSSTTTTSWGSRLRRSCRNRLRLPRFQPSSRCRVWATGRPTASRWSSNGAPASAVRTASCSRAAALPVGAVSAIRSGRSDWSASSASSPATAVVLPVPGPPVSTVVHCRAAASAAARCSSYRSSKRTRRHASRGVPRPPPEAAATAGRPGRRAPGTPRASSGRGRARRPRRARTPACATRLAATRSTQPSPGQASPLGQRLGGQPGAGRGTPTRAAATAPPARARARRRRRARAASAWIRRATWTSAASTTPGGVEAAEHAGQRRARSGGRAGRRSRTARSSDAPSSRSLSSVTSAAGGDQSKTPATCPSIDRRLGAAHAAQEEVEDAAEVARRVVRRQPPAQVAVQDDGVEQRLERVVAVQHRPGHLGAAVVGRRSAASRARRAGWSCSRRRRSGDRRRRHRRPARAAPRRSTRTGSPAAPARRAGRRAGRRTTRAGRRRAGGGAAAGATSREPDVGARPLGPVAAGQRELEVELAEPVTHRDVDQAQPGRERTERGVLRGQQRRRRSRRRRRRPATTAAARGCGPPARLAQVGRLGVGQLEHAVHEAAEGRPRRQVGHRRRHAPARRRPASTSRRRSVVGLVVASASTSGSEVTPAGCSCTRISPEYDVRRHSVSTSRSNTRAASSPGRAGARPPGAASDTDRLLGRRPAELVEQAEDRERRTRRPSRPGCRAPRPAPAGARTAAGGVRRRGCCASAPTR